MTPTVQQYKRAGRYLFQGHTQVEACLRSGILTDEETAKKNAYKTIKNEIVQAELKRLNDIEFDEIALSKREKLASNAKLSRALQDQIEKQIEDKDDDVNHKDIDSFVKIGKRDDVLQGHQISAETNPQDKIDEMIAGWVVERREANNQPNRMRTISDEDIIDVETQET